MNHQHSATCGCKEYLIKASENLVDLKECIDLEQLQCLNESVVGEGRKVFKPSSLKQDKNIWVQSDSDPELLIIIPFITNIKLKTINISARSTDAFPQKLKIFINQENVDFSIIEDQNPVQEFDLVHNVEANIEYSVNPIKFNNVHKLILHLSAEDFDPIEVSYIGLKGIDTKNKSQIVHANYEIKPMSIDQKTKQEFGNQQFIG